jgi:hypothetical protein
MVSGVGEGGIPGGVVAVEVRANLAGSAPCYAATFVGGACGIACRRHRGEVAATLGCGRARRRWHGGCSFLAGRRGVLAPERETRTCQRNQKAPFAPSGGLAQPGAPVLARTEVLRHMERTKFAVPDWLAGNTVRISRVARRPAPEVGTRSRAAIRPSAVSSNQMRPRGQTAHYRWIIQTHPGEPRLPAAAAIVAAIVLYAALPSQLLIGPRFVVPGLELFLFIPLLAANPRRMSRQNRWLRRLSIALLLLIAVSNLVALILLIRQLVTGEASAPGRLLGAAGQVWFTNMLVFALAFWELDRGGPITRRQVERPELPTADFRFPQDEDHDAVSEVARRSAAKSGWKPGFLDYFYVSVTNSSAFSPTDTMPLSARAKLLMAVESVSALILSVLVVSFAVGLLKS